MKSKLTIVTSLTLLLVLFTTAVQASNLQVGPDGTDTGDCQSASCATITYAISQAVDGDIITLQGDITEGMVVVNKAVILDGGNFTLTSTSATYGISIQSPNVTIQNITVNDAGTFGIHQQPTNDGLLIENTTVMNGGGTGFALNCSADITLNDITATGNTGNGISITNSQNVTIDGITTSGNAFSGGFSAGIGIFSSSATCTPDGTSDITIQGTVSIAEPVAVYEEATTGTIANVSLPVTFTHFLGLNAPANSKFHYTSLLSALAAADNTLLLYPAYQPLVYVKEVGGTNLYVAPKNLASVDMSIQAAVNAATAGDSINVAAGTYVEDIVVDKSLTLLGPNANINPNTGTRVAEAVIHPAISAPDPDVCEVMVYLETSGVTIKGFTFDGDNPSLTSGVVIDGADVDACEIMAGYEGMGNITVENNVLKHSTYSGIDFYNYYNPTATSGNYIRYNRFENIGETTYNWGIGILIYNNFYAEITDNVMTGVRTGVQTGNYYQANPGTTGSINNNEIGVWRLGIFHNLTYSNASPFTISGNTFTAESYPGANKWNGLLLSSIGGAVNATITDNDIVIPNTVSFSPPGYTAGYNVWNVTTTAPIAISGGTVTGGDYGVFVNNFDGYSSNANNTDITIDGVSITDAIIAGVYVKDNPSNTNDATVSATVVNNIIDSPTGSVGILLEGGDASATANYNQILGDNGVENPTGVLMDATYNWWGNVSGPSGEGPGIGSSVSVDVDFYPWCTNSACTTFVDLNHLIIPTGSNTATSAAIINSAPSGATVTYEGGTYPGGVVITNPGVTINLNGVTVGAGSPAFTIAAPDVTIEGPGVLDGDGDPSPAVLVNAGGDNFTLKDAEVREWADGVEVAANVTSFKLFDNWIHSNTDAGLQVNSGVTIGGVVSIQGNLFKVNGGNGIQHDGNGTLPAEYNSWGHVDGPASGDGVSANVDADPWTFAEVYLDVEPETEAILLAVNEGDSFDVALKGEAENINGVTFTFTYDTDKLTLNSTTFTTPWDGTCFPAVPAPPSGTISYQCFLLGPEWDGGTVATFNFTADLPNILPDDDGPWSALFDISHQVADTSAGALNGAKVFVNNAGFNDPSIPDRDITDANDGQIDITGLANFTGFVDLQGRANDSGVNVQIYNQGLKAGSALLAQGTSAAGGGYTTTYLSPNQLFIGTTYWFQVDRALYLPTTVVATAGALPPVPDSWGHSASPLTRPLTTLNTIVLLGGDATNDDVIEIGDATCIGGQYGLAPAACGTGGTGDVNEDSVVNILDLTLMGGNFEKNSSPWIP